MDTNLQLLKQFYRELNVPETVEGINQRMILQKVALLGQTMGVSLDYTYNWYVKGPYSPTLTEDYFKLQGYLAEDSQFNFNEETKSKLAILSQIIHKQDEDNSILPRWVEALASLAFLINKSHKTEEQATQVLLSEKPHIETRMRDEALATLKEYNLINAV